MRLHVDTPSDHKLHNFCPRAEGRGAEYMGEYGFAVAITSDGLIRCFWDEGGWNDCKPEEVILTWGQR